MILNPLTGLPYGERRLVPDMTMVFMFVEKDGIECVRASIPALQLETLTTGDTPEMACGRAAHALVKRAMDPAQARADAIAVVGG